MFCEKCGAKLEEGAKFCTNCGANIETGEKVSKTQEKIPDTEVQLQVKPTYSFTYKVLPSLIVYVLIILIIGVPVMVAEPGVGLGIIFFALLIVGVIYLIKVLVEKTQYKNYTYNFYKTKIIYKDSFLNVSEKEVKYKYIREVTMRQTFVQRWFNIGNIILFTNAETGFGNGIFIRDVKNVQDIYKQIKTIIDV